MTLVFALLLTLGAGAAQAAPVTAECPTTTTHTAGNRVECTEDNTSTDDISLDLDGVAISTEDANEDGIKATHAGGTSTTSADITIDVTGTSTNKTISTTGAESEGIHGRHTGTGDITINIEGKTTGMTTTPSTITTTTTLSHGIIAEQKPPAMVTAGGDIDITLGDTQISTDGPSARGVSAFQNRESRGAVTATLNPGVTITTTGMQGVGVHLVNLSDKDNTRRDTTLTANEVAVTTEGDGARALWVQRVHGDGAVTIDLDGSMITTKGDSEAHAIYANVGDGSNGNITIDARDSIITTGSVMEEGGTSMSRGYFSMGIYAQHQATGNIQITTQEDLHISTTSTKHWPGTTSTFSYGIWGVHQGSGNITIDMLPGSSVTTHGSNSHGVVAYHYGTEDARRMDITVGGPVTTEGADAQGVRVGTISSAGVLSRMAALDDNGFRRQTVTVNGPITSAGEGVFLVNGGRVIIGPRGSIRSSKGIAILATGTVPEVPDDTNTPENEFMAAIPPKLYVDLNLGGRQVAQALGDDWIINDDGQTTIAVNNVVLHDGVRGVTGRTAPNGVWDVRMAGSGTNVTRYTDDPMTMDIDESDSMHWTKAPLAEGVAVDRDFSASDFTEVRRPPPPPPEPEPKAMDINEAVMADEDEVAAVHIEGDGTVRIGAQGSVRAASGIAILATRDTPGTTPELTVDLDLDGRTVSQVIGDDWIINDGGGTTINVNGVTLHDATTGVVPDAVAPNGAFNTRVNDEVRIRTEGVRVTDRSDPDPANWTITEPAAGVIADRDFSAADFIETADGAMPRPPMMIEEYAPRAAVYEALPSVLLGLQERTPTAPRTRQPSWLHLTGHTGSQDFARSTVGAEYDIDAVQLQAGKHFTFANGTEAWATLRYLDGTAEVDSPVQGGDIGVQGLALVLELCRGCKDGEKYVSGEV
ncbi:MAG: hypothetical protein OXG06_06125, partial [Gammaproteobacteria bacterium]|nr:hypothetical protein [Gammaproteobacteria bacterium]